MLDQYCLKQANFQKNFTEGVKALRQNPDLSDVTLVVENGGRISGEWRAEVESMSREQESRVGVESRIGEQE